MSETAPAATRAPPRQTPPPGPASAPPARPTTEAAAAAEEAVTAAARQGDAALCAALLAAAAGVPRSAVARAGTLRSTRGIVSLAWQAGFTMGCTGLLQTTLAFVPPSQAIRPTDTGGFPLTEREMLWHLAMLTGAAETDPPLNRQAALAGPGGDRLPKTGSPGRGPADGGQKPAER